MNERFFRASFAFGTCLLVGKNSAAKHLARVGAILSAHLAIKGSSLKSALSTGRKGLYDLFRLLLSVIKKILLWANKI